MAINLLRRQAKERGDKLYASDKPCKRGHNAMIRVDNGSCVECLAENNKLFMANNKDSVNARRRNYRLNNPDKYEQTKQLDSFKLNVAKQSKLRIMTGNASYARMNGRMREMNRVAKWDSELTELVCKEAHHLARLRDKSTGIKWSVDHIIPLGSKIVSGLHVWNNLQVIPLQENRIKHTKLGI